MSKQKIKILLLTGGFIFFCVLIYKVGLSNLYQNLCLLKWKILIILLPYPLIFVLDTLGWRHSFKGHKISFKNLFTVRLAGESINMIVPSANFAGEPVKAYLLKKYNVPLVDGLASVVISKTIMAITQIIFVMLGVGFLIFKLDITGTGLATSIIIILLGIPIIIFIIMIQKRGIFTLLAKLLKFLRLKIRYVEEREHRLRELDENILQFYVNNKKDFFISSTYFLLGWLTGLLEVFVVLYFLGIPTDFISTYIIESLSTVAKGVTSFIPGSVGGQEGGIIMIFKSLGLGAGIALTFGILRRLRELIWTTAGLFVLSKHEWSMTKFAPEGPNL